MTSGSSTTTPPPDVPDDCHPELYGECDPWCQDCPEGEKCLPWANDGGGSWNATRCSPIAPAPKAPGEPCSAPEGPTAGIDDCEKGAMCWDVELTTLEGVCVEQCSGSPDAPKCSEFDAWCMVANEDVLGLCLPWCHPLDAAGRTCNLGYCFYYQDGDTDSVVGDLPHAADDARFVCATATPTGSQGTPCSGPNHCRHGLTCADRLRVPNCQAQTGCCTAWCSLAAPECPDGTVCTKLLEPHPELPPEFDDLGLCLSP